MFRSKSLSRRLHVIPDIPLVDVFLIVESSKNDINGKNTIKILSSYPPDTKSQLQGINLV